jgi:hypothetical protein
LRSLERGVPLGDDEKGRKCHAYDEANDEIKEFVLQDAEVIGMKNSSKGQ